MAAITCPRCHQDFVHRSPIRGPYQQVVSALHFYPFMCQLCDHRFTAFSWRNLNAVGDDYREFERVPARIPTEVSWAAGKTEGTVTDLSIGGCSLRTNTAIPDGESLQLKIRISQKVPPIVVDAAVVRFSDGNKLGLQFLDIREREKERVRDYVRGSSYLLKKD